MCFFFFKQKTAYEISACLVGSEMCIRDRLKQAIKKMVQNNHKLSITKPSYAKCTWAGNSFSTSEVNPI